MRSLRQSNAFLLAGALLAAVGVGMGAFGAHGLKGILPSDLMPIYETAVQYQLWHALGILFIGVVSLLRPGDRLLTAAGWVMLLGTVVFSGSLYLLTLTGMRWLGGITPLGGVALIISWLIAAVGLARR